MIVVVLFVFVMLAVTAIIPVSIVIPVAVTEVVPAVVAVTIVIFRKGKSAKDQGQAQEQYQTESVHLYTPVSHDWQSGAFFCRKYYQTEQLELLFRWFMAFSRCLASFPVTRSPDV